MGTDELSEMTPVVGDSAESICRDIEYAPGSVTAIEPKINCDWITSREGDSCAYHYFVSPASR